MANTTWNPADKGSTLTLSNLNLTATTGTAAMGGVRSVDSSSAGKLYWEATLSTWIQASTCIGIANASAFVTNASFTSINAAMVQKNGAIFINNAAAPGNPLLGARSSGNIIGLAADFDAKLLWLRVCPASNWNGNAGFAPGGSGGVNITALGLPLYIWTASNGPSEVITLNVGDSAFSGAVPGGYTAGFPVGGGTSGGGTTQARAMVLA